MTTVLRLLIAVAAIGSVAASAQDTVQTTKRSCETNFVVEGSFFSGKTYKTWQEHPGTKYEASFRKVAQEAAASGWGSVTPNKDLGIISAGQSVTMGKGATAPLNVLVKESSGGVRVEVNFSTSAGQTASEETARTQLCKLVEAPSR